MNQPSPEVMVVAPAVIEDLLLENVPPALDQA